MLRPTCHSASAGALVAVYQVGPVALKGDSLSTARATLRSDTGQWVVNPVFKGGADGIGLFNTAAGQCFSKSTTCPTGQLAIVLDGRVISAPAIQTASFQADQIQITGGPFTEREAKDLATSLKYGALPVVLEQQQAQIVSATLGRDALRAGLVSGAVGLFLVTLYMAAFYRVLGLLSIVKLTIEGALLWSIISYLGTSSGLALTLAGITGIIVSIGVSVDSNVVYYEHLKEDVHNGRTIRSATDRAFHSSFSHHREGRRRLADRRRPPVVAHGRSGARLRLLPGSLDRSGPRHLVGLHAPGREAGDPLEGAPEPAEPARHPRGEGAVGRPGPRFRPPDDDRRGPMSWLGRLNRGETDIDFLKVWKRTLLVSAVLVLISLVSLFTRGLNLGIDFEGGVSWEVKAPGVSVERGPRRALGSVGEGSAKIQTVGTDTIRVQGPEATPEHEAEVRQTLADVAGTDVAEVSVSTVGASWGSDITSSAVRALVFFFIAILIYLSVRLEWRMAVAAIVAVVHDVLISVGVYSVFQFEVTPGTVIAFLTILGYSIYDTIVVDDKIKENERLVGLNGRMTYGQMTSLSMNQVLLRSLNTSISSILPVIALLVVGAGIMGAVTLEEFSIALLVGLVVGAYSSIGVAAPVLVWLKEREPKNRTIRERLAAQGISTDHKAARPSDRPCSSPRTNTGATPTRERSTGRRRCSPPPTGARAGPLRPVRCRRSRRRPPSAAPRKKGRKR